MNPILSSLQASSLKESIASDHAYTLQDRNVLDYDILDRDVLDHDVLDHDIQDRSMNSEQLCPCCSNILLRHISDSRIYWRCGYCYQEMPVMEDHIVSPL